MTAGLNISSLLGSRNKRDADNIERIRDTTHYHDREFAVYSKGLFKRLDVIIDRLGSLTLNDESESSSPTIQSGEPERDNRSPTPSPGGAIIPLLAGMVTSLAPHYFATGLGANWKRIVGAGRRKRIRQRARRMRRWRNRQRSVFGRVRNRFAVAVRGARNRAGQLVRNGIRGLAGGRVGRVADGLRTRASSLLQSGSRIVSRIGGGRLAGLFRALGFLGRRIPLLLTLSTAIQNIVDSSAQIRALTAQLDRGEITQQEFDQQATEHVIQAVINGVGSIGGALVGGILGSVVGPVGTVLLGSAGAWAGEKLAQMFGPRIAHPIAQFLSNNTSIPEAARKISDLLTARIDMRSFLREAPLPDSVKVQILELYSSARAVGEFAQRAGHSLQEGWGNLQRASSNFFESHNTAALSHSSSPTPAAAHAPQQQAPQQQQVHAPAPVSNPITTAPPEQPSVSVPPVVLVNAPQRTVINSRTSTVVRPSPAHTPNLGAAYA